MNREELKKELEKQLQLLSKLSEQDNLDVLDRLKIASSIISLVEVLSNF